MQTPRAQSRDECHECERYGEKPAAGNDEDRQIKAVEPFIAPEA
jgi:hypothetical protein